MNIERTIGAGPMVCVIPSLTLRTDVAIMHSAGHAMSALATNGIESATGLSRASHPLGAAAPQNKAGGLGGASPLGTVHRGVLASSGEVDRN